MLSKQRYTPCRIYLKMELKADIHT